MSQPQFAKFTSSCLKKKQLEIKTYPNTSFLTTFHTSTAHTARGAYDTCWSINHTMLQLQLWTSRSFCCKAPACRQHTSWSLQAKRRASLPTRFAHRWGDHRLLPLTSEPISPAPAKGTACAEVPSPACIPGSCLKGSLFHLHSWGWNFTPRPLALHRLSSSFGTQNEYKNSTAVSYGPMFVKFQSFDDSSIKIEVLRIAQLMTKCLLQIGTKDSFPSASLLPKSPITEELLHESVPSPASGILHCPLPLPHLHLQASLPSVCYWAIIYWHGLRDLENQVTCAIH